MRFRRTAEWGENKKRKRPEPEDFTWEHGSLLGSGKRIAQSGWMPIGVVREAKMSFHNVTRDVPGNTLASLRKLCDGERLSQVVMNDQNVFAAGPPRFHFLTAAHIPGILRYLRGSDIGGISARS